MRNRGRVVVRRRAGAALTTVALVLGVPLGTPASAAPTAGTSPVRVPAASTLHHGIARASSPRSSATGSPTLTAADQTVKRTGFASVLTSQGDSFALTQQTVNGAAASAYGVNPALTPDQQTVAEAGFQASLAYPTGVSAPPGVSARVISSAVGASPGNIDPETCLPKSAGLLQRVSLTKFSTAGSTTSSFHLQLSGEEKDGFPADIDTTLANYADADAPTAVTVLDPSCSGVVTLLAAVTFPTKVVFYHVDSTFVFKSVVTYTAGSTILASAHENNDEGYLAGSKVNGVQNSVMTLAVQNAIILLHVKLVDSANPSGALMVTSTTVPLTPNSSPVTAATLSYDTVVGTNGTTVTLSGVAEYRTQMTTTPASYSAFGSSFSFTVTTPDLADSPGNTVSGTGCTSSTGLPGVDAKFYPALVPDKWTLFTACAAPNEQGHTILAIDGGGTAAPADLGADPVVDPNRPAASPFIEFPCFQLHVADSTKYCSNMNTLIYGEGPAAVVVEPTTSGTQRFLQTNRFYLTNSDLPAASVISSVPVAGSTSDADQTAVEMPLEDVSQTVHYNNLVGQTVQSPAAPVAYILPGPTVGGLTQNVNGDPELALSTSGGTSTSQTFGWNVGAQTQIGVGEPALLAVEVTASVEFSSDTTSSDEETYQSSDSYAAAAGEPTIVYATTPEWDWQGTVTADSTGLASAVHSPVDTRIPTGDDSLTTTGSVANLAQVFPDTFGPLGTYADAIEQIFGDGVYDHRSHYVGDGDPGFYPTISGSNTSAVVSFAPDGHTATTAYCDGTNGALPGATTLRSGTVLNPFTAPDDTSTSQTRVLTSATHSVSVGNDNYEGASLQIDSARSASYASTFSANVGIGIEVADGDFKASVDVGISLGVESTFTVGSGTEYDVSVGNITGDGPGPSDIDDKLKSERYNWQAFLCHRTLLVKGDLASALVLGTAVSGYTGSGGLDPVSAATPLSPQRGALAPMNDDGRVPLTWQGNGTVYDNTVEVQGADANDATIDQFISTPAQTPTDAKATETDPRAVGVPDLAPGESYRWRVSEQDFNGATFASDWNYFVVPATPVAFDQSTVLPAGATDITVPVTAGATGSGEPNPRLVPVIVTPPTHGTAVVSGTGILYVPGATPTTDSLHFAVKDTTSGLVSATHTLTINVVGLQTSISLAPLPASVGYGTPLSPTAILATAGTVPAGVAVQILDNGTVIGSVVPNAQGIASVTVPRASVGTHAYSAYWPGGGTTTSATSNTVVVTVNPATSTLSASTPSSALVVAQPTTLSATILPATATGTVTFTDNGATLGSASLVGGVATISGVTLPLGTHDNLRASYGGGDGVAAATSAPVTPAVVVRQDSSTTTTALPAGAQSYGVPLTASVAVTSGHSFSGAPGGFIDVTVDGVDHVAPITAGSTSVPLGTLPVGSHSVGTTYLGDANHAASAQETHSLTVVPDPTTTTASTPSRTYSAGATPTLTVQVDPADSGAGTPTGIVSIAVNGSPSGRVRLLDGTGTLVLPGLHAGTTDVVATYAGDTDHAASTAATVALIVTPDTTSVSVPDIAVVSGQPGHVTAVVSPDPGGGTVAFTIDGTPVGAAVPVGSTGSAAVDVPTDLALGAHSVTAIFSGSGDFTGSSGTGTLRVTPPAVTVTPAIGPTGGGTAVSVTGAGFTGATAVDFGGTPATDVTVLDDEHLTAVSPAGTGALDVTVTSPVGTSAVGPSDRFAYSVYSPRTGRVLDTRRGLGAQRVGPGKTITVVLPGLLPSTRAVILNLTGTRLSGAVATYVSACAGGQPVAACRTTSVLNVLHGADVADQITVPVGPGGTVEFYNAAGAVDLVADFAGELSDGYLAVTPTRVLDTRSGVGHPVGKLGPAKTTVLHLPQVPAGDTATLTVTAVGGTAPLTDIAVCPASETLPSCTASSSLNPVGAFALGQQVSVQVSPSNDVTLYNAVGSVDLIVDLDGYYTDGYLAGAVERVIDTRTGLGVAKQPLTPNGTTFFTVPQVPAGVVGVQLGATAVGLTGSPIDYLTVCTGSSIVCGTGVGATSALNPRAGRPVANQVTVPMGSDGNLTVYNKIGSVQLAVDIRGFYVVDQAPQAAPRDAR